MRVVNLKESKVKGPVKHEKHGSKWCHCHKPVAVVGSLSCDIMLFVWG